MTTHSDRRHTHLIIPAAGAGSRLRGERSKLFTYLSDNRTLLDIIIENAYQFFDRITLILSPDGASLYRDEFSTYYPDTEFLIQEEPTGMLDALDLFLEQMKEQVKKENLFIQWGDQPFVETTLYESLDSSLPHCFGAIPLIWVEKPYVQFKFDSGQLTILETREGDSTDEFGFKDMGVFAFKGDLFSKAWSMYRNKIKPGRSTNEKSFLKMIPLLLREGIIHWDLLQPSYMGKGINTREELLEARELFVQLSNIRTDIKKTDE